ncbi:hypothetical protein [Brevundimonas balnearis]|uniref:Uncharacterized protein n=1 Tax=Brevundimonas balnearis TaxID=1572858 RepID=A0ABV6R087_9CAUL
MADAHKEPAGASPDPDHPGAVVSGPSALKAAVLEERVLRLQEELQRHLGRAEGLEREARRRSAELIAATREVALAADRQARAERQSSQDRQKLKELERRCAELEKQAAAAKAKPAAAKPDVVKAKPAAAKPDVVKPKPLTPDPGAPAVAPVARPETGPTPVAKQSPAPAVTPVRSGATPPAPPSDSLKRRAARWLRGRPGGPTPPDDRTLILRSGLFDPDWYLQTYRDVAAAGVDALDHYRSHGFRERRRPGPGFDPDWYAKQAGAFDGDALLHYLKIGRRSGLTPCPPVVEPPDGLAEVLESKFFNAQWYSARWAPGATPRDAAIHYLTVGWREGADPSPDFGTVQYLDVHQDVREAGVNPLVHYVRHGRAERRERPASRLRQEAPADAAKAVEVDRRDPPVSEAATGPLVRWRRAESFSEGEPGAVVLSGALFGRVATEADRTSAERVLHTFAALSEGGDAVRPDPAFSWPDGFQGLQDVAYVSDADLRVFVLSRPVATVVRLYQRREDTFGLLVEQVIEPDGFGVTEAALADAYAPVLCTVTDADGVLMELFILAFPSLARGGVHYAELRAAGHGEGSDAATYGARQALSRLNARPSDRLGRILVDLADGVGGERITDPAFVRWLRRQLGVRLSTQGGRNNPAAALLRTSIEDPVGAGADAPAAATLIIPATAVPTIDALCTPVDAAHGPSGGGFILADTARHKPLWAIMPPEKSDGLGDLQPAVADVVDLTLAGAERSSKRSRVSTEQRLLAIVFREQVDTLGSNRLVRVTAASTPALRGGRRRSAPTSPYLAVVAATPQTDLHAVVASLASQTVRPERVLACGPSASELAAALGAAKLTAEAVSAPVPDAVAALESTGPFASLLFLDHATVLHDPRTAETLGQLLQGRNIATAACQIVADLGEGRGDRSAFVSGGVFPSRVDFRDRPHVLLDEPDLRALPPMTYPATAQRFRVAMVKRSALQAVGGLNAAAGRDWDIDLCVRFAAAGWMNLCTSALTAAVALEDLRSVRVEPRLPATLTPADWGRILGTTTLLRKLQ